MLMNAAVNALTTVALLDCSIPKWFVYLVLGCFIIFAPFSIPKILRCFVESFKNGGFKKNE